MKIIPNLYTFVICIYLFLPEIFAIPEEKKMKESKRKNRKKVCYASVYVYPSVLDIFKDFILIKLFSYCYIALKNTPQINIQISNISI